MFKVADKVAVAIIFSLSADSRLIRALVGVDVGTLTAVASQTAILQVVRFPQTHRPSSGSLGHCDLALPGQEIGKGQHDNTLCE
ncbi:MAG TPA: hypothetical protein VNO32_03730 [Candidatus Acidoferrum sp.]|nr:hypothetical protein [Candidatus Acidoferrum sp.]